MHWIGWFDIHKLLDELEKRLSMGDPFLKGIVKEGKVLYG
jgi:hypothetical protein